MSSVKPGFYVTSPIFYPNANLHLGHAYTMVVCDVLARYHRLHGEPTYFLTGSDENSSKVIQAAEAAGVGTEDYLTGIVAGFQSLFASLDTSYDQFIRTTDQERHWPGAQTLWKQMVETGDIYKGTYEGYYCVGCESFKTEKDLLDGKCPDHGTAPEYIVEDNYFFRLSHYADRLREKIATDEIRIVPEKRKNELLAMIDAGLSDISFSRPKAKIPFAIPVPGDPEHVMYVWCDALTNYITALGYGREDTSLYTQFWPADVHVVGKDILKFHALYWPAMLMSAGVSLPRAILCHGMITSGGRKMSKSLGNVIDPRELIAEYGTDALRYYLAREVSPFEDGDMTLDKFKEVYNANLANGLGNLASRIMTMSEKYLEGPVTVTDHALPERYRVAFLDFDIKTAADVAWAEIGKLDAYIQETQPFKLIKVSREAAEDIIRELVDRLNHIATLVTPFLPDAAEKIKTAVRENHKPENLFVRKD